MSCTKFTTYTDKDVERLVEAADAALGGLAYGHHGGMVRDVLMAALAPFQPDPDVELIESMVANITREVPMVSSTVVRGIVRAALTTYRTHTNGGAK